MSEKRFQTAATLALLACLASAASPALPPTSIPSAHPPSFPPLDDDESREPAILEGEGPIGREG